MLGTYYIKSERKQSYIHIVKLFAEKNKNRM